METAARARLWDESLGLFVSGPARQVSWASQAWMVLAGATSPEQAKRAISGVSQHPAAIKPVTPYAHHYVVEALLPTGQRDEAWRYVQSYWGGMIEKGADTFWDVYVPNDDRLSPYDDHLINS